MSGASQHVPATLPDWLDRQRPGHDVALSARVRLVRNVAAYPFPGRMTSAQRQEVVEQVGGALRGLSTGDLSDGRGFTIFSLDDETLDRRLLHERGMLSTAALGAPECTLALEAGGSTTVAINDVDHLRLAGYSAGLDLDRAHAAADRLESALDEPLQFAASLQLGYLTAAPTELGTGLRATIVLHLPALTHEDTDSDERERTQRASRRSVPAVTRTVVRRRHRPREQHAAGDAAIGLPGAHGSGRGGEHGRLHEALYQVSSSVAFGAPESAVIAAVEEAAKQLVQRERAARQRLLEQSRLQVEDRVWRAYGILTSCRRLSVAEAMHQLSWLRLGAAAGLLEGSLLVPATRLFFLCQEAHVLRVVADRPDVAANSPPADRIASARAWLVRTHLKEHVPHEQYGEHCGAQDSADGMPPEHETDRTDRTDRTQD